VRLFKLIAFISITLILLALSLANNQLVTLHVPLYPEWHIQLPLYFLFFIGVLLGIVVSAFIFSFTSAQHKHLLKKQKKLISRLEKQNLPIPLP
jgi:uncharacterized integral membrane protein